MVDGREGLVERRGRGTWEGAVCVARLDRSGAVAGRALGVLEHDGARGREGPDRLVAEFDARWRGRWRGANGVHGGKGERVWVHGEVGGDDVHDGGLVDEV